MDKKECLKELEVKVTELYKTVDKNSKGDVCHNCFEFSSFKLHTSVRFIDDDDVENFNDLVNFLLSYDQFNEAFSEYYISERIIQLFHKILNNHEKSFEYIEHFYNDLIDTSNIEWYVISKMDNVEVLESHPFQIIDCTIKLVEISDLPNENYIGYEDYVGKTGIFTKIRAGDSEKARNVALNRFNICFNLLRLYTHNFEKSLKGILVTGNQDLIIWNNIKNSYGTIKPSLNHLCDSEGKLVNLNSVNLSNKLYAELKQDEIQYLSTVNPISKVVKDCLYWFGLGLDATMESAKLMNFTTVLETALKKNEETTELKQRISDRCSFLLGEDYETRIKIRDDISSIYNKRSKIVHQGAIIRDKDVVNLVGYYAKSILIKLIRENSRLNGNFSKFIMEIDEKKYM